MSMNKPSILLLAFSLMLLGICFFFSGLLLGGFGLEKGTRPPGLPLPKSILKRDRAPGLGTPPPYRIFLALCSMPPGATKLGRAAGEARILTDSSGRQTHSSTASSPPSAQQTQAEGKAAGDEAERASPSSEDKTAYTVQLGAFVSKENALDFLWSKITQMSAAKYFASIPQVCRDHGGDLELFRWEMVLGQTLSPYSISLSRASEAWGAILFANYQTPGVHRLALGNVVNAHIFLEFQLTQEKGSQFSFSALQLYQPQVLYEQRQKTASFWCGLF